MTSRFAESAASLLNRQTPIHWAEVVRASLGAGVGMAIAGAVSTFWSGTPGAAPLLIAPMGASAVLLFSVPASPFAQPYAFVAGNLIAAAAGVTVATLIPYPLLGAALAVAVALAAMALCRCLHPPSGAVALTAVLGGPHVLAAGYGLVVVPVLLNTILLLAAALAFNSLTRRTYPHFAHPVVHRHPPSPPSPLTRADFEAVIGYYAETLAIAADHLEILFDELLGRAQRARRATTP